MDVNVKNQLFSRTAKIITYLMDNENSNIVQISRALEIDYNFVSKIVQRCEEANILKSVMDNRQKMIKLTPKGRKIAEILNNLQKIL